MSSKIDFRPERPEDSATITALHRDAFGPGAYARAAFRVREQAPHDPGLSFVAHADTRIIGSVRLTSVRVGEARGFLLGPLVVAEDFAGQGYGRGLARHALEVAAAAGHGFVILVGDEPYYGPLGFKVLPRGAVRMPGPVDPMRLLVAELQPGAAEGLAGLVSGDALVGTAESPAEAGLQSAAR